MNKHLKAGLFATLALFCLTLTSFVSANEYDDLAKELSQVNISTGQAKIAILPFSYLDKRKSDGGAIVAERLTTRMVKIKKFQVIERQLLENVIQEQHLETTGIVDAETAKQIGKILGVDAVVNGTLMDLEYGNVEVNARLIKTDTAEVLSSASIETRKIWPDVSVNQPQAQQAQVQQAAPTEQPQEAYKPAPPKGRVYRMHGYIDFFMGSNSGNMKVIFNNTSRTLKETEMGLDFNGSGSLDSAVGINKIAFSKLEANSTGPLGLRVVGFGKNWGFGYEVSYFDQAVKKQNTTASYNDGPDRSFSFFRDNWIKVGVFNFLSGDIYLRLSDKMFQPYLGFGLGFTLNSITSDYIRQSSPTSASMLNTIGFGYIVRLPILGLRVNLGENSACFIENRTLVNTATFNRNNAGETDTITINANQTLFGLDYKF